MKRHTLQQLEDAMHSADQAARVVAVQDLANWAEKDSSIRSGALAVFRRYLEIERDPWSSIIAARAVEQMVGAVEARPVWLKMLHSPRIDFVAAAALATTDPFYVPSLIGLLHQRGESSIHLSVVRTLGRSQNPAALEAILARLGDPEVRPHAIAALADFGDPRAISHLEPLLNDTSDAWPEDNHGPMMRVCDVAQDAIHKLRGSGSRPAPSVDATPRPAPLPLQPSPPPPPLPAGANAPRRPFHIAALIPLFAAGIEIPFIAVVLFIELFTRGKLSDDRASVQKFDLIAMIPVGIGLACGLIFIARRRGRGLRIGEWICLAIGCVACGVFLFAFGWELSH